MFKNFKNNLIKNKIYIFFLFIFFLGSVFFSHYYFSHIAYFYTDHRWFESLHNISKNKGVFEVLINSTNINGIIWQIINPKINILSYLNFNLENDKSYFLYLTILRFFEIITCFLYVRFFVNAKIEQVFLFTLFIYFILLQNFSIFDHNSYINFPIILMNCGIALSLYFLDKKIFFFLILFFSSFFSFLINPIYFFIPCFLPLLFLYFFLLYKKKFLNFFLALLSNSPFAIIYSLIAIGTARLNLSEILNPLDKWYNFEIFSSVIFIVLMSSFFLLRMSEYIKNKNLNYLDYVFIALIFFSVIFGIVWKFDLLNWQMPQPIYFDYSIQFIYILIFVKIFFITRFQVFKVFFLFILTIIFSYKIFNYSKSYFIHESYVDENRQFNYNSNGSLVKKFFWEKDSNLYFQNELYKKTIILDIPNYNTSLFKYAWTTNDKYNLDQKLVLLNYSNFKLFNHNFNHYNFHKSLVRTNAGHSAYMGISTFLANISNLNEKYDKETIPKLDLNSKLLSVYKPDYLLSDKILNYPIEKKYTFEKFNIYLYKLNFFKSKKLKIKKSKNLNEYYKNINNFDKNLYIFNKEKLNMNEINICDYETKFENNISLIFSVKNNSKFKCVVILPITFSYNNILIDKNKNKEIETFRAQYHFHGIIIKNNINIIIKKRNLIKYPIYSFKDYLEFRKLKK